MKQIIFILLLPSSYICFLLSSYFPNTVETIYSKKIFIAISSILSVIFNLIPISISEISVIILLSIIIIYLIILLYKVYDNPSNIRKIVIKYSLKSLSFVGIIYFLFIFLWGFNYNRLPLSNTLDLNSNKTNIDDLEDLCIYLLDNTIKIRDKLEEDSNGRMVFTTNVKDIIKNANKGYKKLPNHYQIFKGTYSQPKQMYLLSYFYSTINIGGIYSPFTGEANINIISPHVFLPFTICHEMAHQRGIARENEANFISYLACIYHPDNNFKYAGYLRALQYSMIQLYKYDKVKYNAIKIKYTDGINNDLNMAYQFWKKYVSITAQKTVRRINDNYLKANNQDDGVRSYGKVVDLLIADHKKNLNNL